jgi:glycosyltransferase involved in cell wall biosynthesis
MKQSIIFICGNGDTLINFRKEFIQCFLERDYEVYAIAPEISSSEHTKLSELGVIYREIPFRRKGINPLEFIRSIYFLYIEINKIKPDLVFSYTHKSVVIGSIASRFARVKGIYSMITGRGHIFDNETLFKKLRCFFGILSFKFSLKYNDKVFFQNPDDIDLFLTSGALKRDKVIMVNGSGVNLDYFNTTELPENLIFLCAARLLKSKGLVEFAEAFKLFKNDHPYARALLVGSPDDHDDSVSLEEIESEWKNRFGIEYLGHFSDIREAIKLSSVFVLLSYNEGTPRSVLEAMAMGRPILTTDVPGCRETVLNGQNGFLAKVRDPVDTARLMKNFTTKENRKALGIASRKLSEEKFDVRKVNQVLLQNMKI